MSWSCPGKTELLVLLPVYLTVTCPIRKQPKNTFRAENIDPDPLARFAHPTQRASAVAQTGIRLLF